MFNHRRPIVTAKTEKLLNALSYHPDFLQCWSDGSRTSVSMISLDSGSRMIVCSQKNSFECLSKPMYNSFSRYTIWLSIEISRLWPRTRFNTGGKSSMKFIILIRSQPVKSKKEGRNISKELDTISILRISSKIVIEIHVISERQHLAIVRLPTNQISLTQKFSEWV